MKLEEAMQEIFYHAFVFTLHPKKCLEALKVIRKSLIDYKQLKDDYAEATSWMEHVKPLYQRKQEYETEILAKQEELEKVRQEYRNFLATIRQLTEEKHDT